ncbi:MAG: YdeI/OmpD-associated family protein [Allorhizobium sp.]
MITAIEDYFAKGCGRCGRFDTPDCSTRTWKDGLNALRHLCLETGLSETVSWGHPCYRHQDRNIVIVGATRGDFRLTFFNAALMTDSSAVLEKRGPNTRHPDMLRFTDNHQVQPMTDVIRAYLKEAVGYSQAGVKPPREAIVGDLPDELLDALDGDPELAEAFWDLTPGRQRSYVIHLTSTSRPETRLARISKCRANILAGKGAMER